MNTIQLILIIAAAILAFLKLIGVPSRVDLVALAVLLLAGAMLLGVKW